jgi:formylglycine-generating enzyme required for sulfatase activity
MKHNKKLIILLSSLFLSFDCISDTKTIKEETSNSSITLTNSIGMEFVKIPSGNFLMGCVEKDKSCFESEKPQHKVTISKSFYIGKFLVTQGQWTKVMDNNPSFFKCGNNCPVGNMTWEEVDLFINNLNSLEKGKNYRLPTEAEWEYASRAGTSSIYYWGDELNNDYLWYENNSGDNPHPVGWKKPNAFGLYDMIGNVWEWTQDWLDIKYYENSPSIDPQGPLSGTDRVIRGGPYYLDGKGLRNSLRGRTSPEKRNRFLGIRLVLTELNPIDFNNNLEENQKSKDFQNSKTLIEYYVNDKQGLYLRSKPGQDNPTMDLLPYGTKIIVLQKTNNKEKILGNEGNWVYVQKDQKKGYVFDYYLSIEKPK